MNFRVVAFRPIVPTVRRHLGRTYGRQQNSTTNSPTTTFRRELTAAADALGMCVMFLSSPVFDGNCVPDVCGDGARRAT